MNVKNQSRNNSIDVFKTVLLFFLLTAHSLPNSFPEIGPKTGVMFCLHLNSFSRIVVPIFFILTGYFLRNRLQDGKYIVKYLKRLAILYFVWQLIYLKFILKAYNANIITFESLLLDLFWGIGHLWYLNATILAVFFIFLIRNFETKTKLQIAFFLLFICYSLQIIMKYQMVFNVDKLREILWYLGTERNFLFYGLPYILLGTLYDNWKVQINKINFLLIPLLILIVLESYFYIQLGKRTFNIFLTALPISLILVNKVLEGQFKTSLKINPTLPIGIYLCHFYAVYYVFRKFPNVPIEFEVFKFLLICLLTIVIWFVLDKINKKFPYFF
ncbi:acyltransferase family protein [Flavobacterium sp.]|uniref:acyltransferase family protein n=1 Tax=Flavobacterium sp. TaxID=239 RepID=UPI00286D718C|nr:acyltransferase family protein [Flavobacterium sp.]